MPVDPHDGWTGGPSPARLPPGAPTIGAGRFVLTDKVAEGGMAGVYRAWDHRMRCWRAIKVLLPEFAERRSLRTRFETEAHTMANLDHPNLIRVFDVGTQEALPYIVMELAEGGTLMAWCDRNGAMPPRMACEAMRQVAMGVQAAHDAGVVHRDVKPHNVLITLDGVCKVTDFGIARVLLGDGMTRTGSTMGTIGYMAPEQRADAKGVDVRADVYSLGAVLYKLLTNTVVTDLFLIEHEPELLETVPAPLHEVLLRSCFHDRDRRFADAQAFADTLGEVAPLLPDDPAGAPPLARNVVPAVPTRTPTADFDEIAQLLAGQELVAPEQVASAQSTPVLPYRMPSVDRTPMSMEDRTDPGIAALYVKEEAGASEEAALDGTVDRTPPPPPLADEETELEPTGSRMLTRVLAVAALCAWLLLALFTVLGAWETRGRAEADSAARAAMYDVLLQEQGVLAELERAGAGEVELATATDLRRIFLVATQEPERLQAAAAYAAAVDRMATAHFGPVGGSSAAEVRTRNVQHAFADWRAARQRWTDTVRSPPGRMATGLGLAPRP